MSGKYHNEQSNLAIMGDDIDYAAMDNQSLDSMTGPLFPNQLYFSPESSLYGSVYAAGVPLNNGQLESYEVPQYQNGYPSPDASARSLSDVSTFSSLSSTSLNREQYTADSSLGGTPMDLENGINLPSKRAPPFGFDSTADSNSAVHDGVHSFPCDEGCDVAFRRIYDLKRHKKEQHRCVHPDCDALRFSNRSEKDQHEALHGGGLQWRCGSCLQIDPSRKPYSRHDKLKRHLKDHHDVSDANLDAFRCNNPSCFKCRICACRIFNSSN
ncbi:hypothetical protein BU24DRAFT_223991 [Aaosphaeria arxii CBS 175.79]|uniref:C2H2-type domain-containing protein n=1 Tax=Aaosphaeria arxii CBS 175.79 TaxID=1450172 RepID=A0A6A5XQ04_9PLEO|nr:uncharacterized protein BU24DRAFT_223991 [Aaosphaeria arxii CBS 175.79]KAF2014917.1 hypothetical protein BU24DRAFT_223991 [Aaosphaeria arxii CBS 175.79]